MSCWCLPVPLDSEFHNIRNYTEMDLLEKYFMLKLSFSYISLFSPSTGLHFIYTHTQNLV